MFRAPYSIPGDLTRARFEQLCKMAYILYLACVVLTSFLSDIYDNRGERFCPERSQSLSSSACYTKHPESSDRFA
jgi:hypothetical protein